MHKAKIYDNPTLFNFLSDIIFKVEQFGVEHWLKSKWKAKFYKHYV